MDRKLLLSKIEDICHMADKRNVVCTSSFLDPASAAFVKRNLKADSGVLCRFFGGYEDAERVIFAAAPFWMEEVSDDEIPIGIVHISVKGDKELTHRDFLGAILSLGISRDVIGDICVKGSKALLFCKSDICEYIVYNLSSVGRAGVVCSIFEADTEEFVKKEVVKDSVNVASLRLDTVISAVFKLSRSLSCSLIEAGKVKLNFEECYKSDAKICAGDLISVRGYGRVRFLSESGVSKKGRLYLDIERFV